MFFSLSTRWNACKHSSGEAMIEEILALGFNHIELSYDVTAPLVPGIRTMVDSGAVCVGSVHAFCPVPSGLPYGHPEMFNLLAPVSKARKNAVEHVVDTIHFAAEVGAETVILHGGNIRLGGMSEKLIALLEEDKRYSDKYDRIKTSLMMKREEKAQAHIKLLYEAVETLIPVLEDSDVNLAFENLPSWESVPTESEILSLIHHFNSHRLRYWHDIGHGHIRQLMGFVSPVRWLEDLAPHLAGMHVHDVLPPASDHIMPPAGKVDFSIYAKFTNTDLPAVLEPYPGLPPEHVTGAVKVLAQTWNMQDNTDCGKRINDQRRVRAE